MEQQGWIKLHRKILNCWIWDIKPFDKGRAWVDLLLLAMHHDTKVVIDDKPIVIGRGSYFTSRGNLANRWGWSVKKVDKYLETLEKEQMITTIRTKKGTTVTIVNYGEYQIEGTTLDTTEDITQGISLDISPDITVGISPDITVGIAPGTQNKNDKECNKNDKELKNEKNDKEKTLKGKTESKAYYPNDELLNNAFKEFVSMRNKIKKPLTAQAVTRAMNKLQKLSNGDNDLAIKILNQSVDHCWQDLYDLKKDNGNGNYQKQLGSNSRDAQFWNLMEQIRRDEEDGT